METVNIMINGEFVALPAPLSVAGLVAQQGLTGQRVAVERNGEIVPRSRHADVQLCEGDRLEIVTAVGGG